MGNGFLDALVGGMARILIGAGLAALYPALERTVLHKADFGEVTLPRLVNLNPWVLVAPNRHGPGALVGRH